MLKYFIGYNDNDAIRPLCVRLPQMTGYAKKINENLTMSFIANNKKLVKNYHKIWEKVENLMRIDFESKLVYGNDKKKNNIKYIKKIKIYTNLITKRMPKEKAPCQCLSTIMLDSVIKAKKYNPETFLEECKYVPEKKNTKNYTDDDFGKSESDRGSNDETESDIDNDEYDG